jgi:hypothetical protein
MLNNTSMDIEPNIVKAQFIINSKRHYTLEFDQNIEFRELKEMIRVAAHLKKNNFRLFCDGDEYTQCHEETFESIFPNKNLVVFSIEPGEGEVYDETELLIQINSPCPQHKEKFLMFYCFDCGVSICSDCFTKGDHKGHHVQDKCYYLLPSKFLVQKMFESWSTNPYEDFKISTDLTEAKNRLNNVFFTQLFNMLKEVQNKCNDLIDNYNNMNMNSLGNLRDSVRDIKTGCIKALDELKERLNIKDIVNDVEIFKNFDIAYKELGRIQNEKFKYNLVNFRELNQNVSILVTGLIDAVYNSILELLKKILSDERFAEIKMKIGERFVRPIDQNEILNFSNSGKK